jgi:hypothetical protein
LWKVERPVVVIIVHGKKIPLTVDGDGNAFVEGVTICPYEGWDFSELVDLEVVGGDTLCRPVEVES